MTEDERSGADLASPDRGVAGGPKSVQGEPASEVAPLGARLGLRVVQQPTDREQAALQLAARLTEAMAQFLLDAERQVAASADRIHASTLENLERQRTNVESLIALFAGRLRRQEETISSQQRVIDELSHRLDRHAEALRSIHEARACDVALLNQSLELLGRLGAAVGGSPGPSGKAGF